MTEKFCKDCKYYNLTIASNARCSKTKFREPVHGDEEMLSCYNVRMDSGKCGKDAAWFEPREKSPLWQTQQS